MPEGTGGKTFKGLQKGHWVIIWSSLGQSKATGPTHPVYPSFSHGGGAVPSGVLSTECLAAVAEWLSCPTFAGSVAEPQPGPPAVATGWLLAAHSVIAGPVTTVVSRPAASVMLLLCHCLLV